MVFAQNVFAAGDPIKEKLDNLERVISSMNADSVARNEKVAGALSTIENIRHDFIALQGQMEGLEHQIKSLQVDVNRTNDDLHNRIDAIEERIEIYDAQISKAVAKVAPGSSGDIVAYQKGLDEVQKGEFLSAVASFRQFLKGNTKSDLAPKAQFWIAECYFSMKDYQKAIKEFQVVIEKYPKSEKVASSILKQGYAFSELGMTEEAKAFLNKVANDFPASNEAVKAKDKILKIDQRAAAVQSAQAQAVQVPPDAHSEIPLAPGVKNQPAKLPVKESSKPLPERGRD